MALKIEKPYNDGPWDIENGWLIKKGLYYDEFVLKHDGVDTNYYEYHNTIFIKQAPKMANLLIAELERLHSIMDTATREERDRYNDIHDVLTDAGLVITNNF